MAQDDKTGSIGQGSGEVGHDRQIEKEREAGLGGQDGDTTGAEGDFTFPDEDRQGGQSEGQ